MRSAVAMRSVVVPVLLLLPLLAGCSPSAVAPTPLASAPVASAPVTPACREGHTVILVRHGEKAEGGGSDPSLSERGQKRALHLAAMLANAHVTRLVASEFQRTQQTLAPLAEKTHLTVEVKAGAQQRELVGELLHAKEGSVSVVASHSNVVPALARELGGRTLSGLASEEASIGDQDFDRMVVLVFGCGAAKPVMLELQQDPQ